MFTAELDPATIVVWLFAAALWSAGTVAVAHRAKSVGRSFSAFLVLGLLVSPVVAFVALVLVELVGAPQQS